MFLLLIYTHSGGLSNFLYYCALPSGAKPKQGEPSKVLVRFYGQIHGEGALEALLTESVIFTLLSERKLGPKLHGIFPGGRLEEFIAVIIIKLQLFHIPLFCKLRNADFFYAEFYFLFIFQ